MLFGEIAHAVVHLRVDFVDFRSYFSGSQTKRSWYTLRGVLLTEDFPNCRLGGMQE